MSLIGHITPTVTVASTCHLLTTLTNLCHLDSPFVTSALLSLPDTQRLSLTDYVVTESDHHDPFVQQTLLSHVVTLCPHLTRVELMLIGTEDILPLCLLRFLDLLALAVMEETPRAYFRDQVEPVLQGIGSGLSYLFLHQFDLQVFHSHLSVHTKNVRHSLYHLRHREMQSGKERDNICAESVVATDWLLRDYAISYVCKSG